MRYAQAGQYIQDVPRRELLLHEWGDTKDIVAAIMRVVDKDHLTAQVADFAKQYKGRTAQEQYDKLEKLWRFCRTQIRYKKDPTGVQYIKHPARVYADGVADCKGLSIFIYHVCRAMGVPVFIRFASYDRDKRIGHVYPVAVINGEAIPVDAVFNRFDDEENPTYIKDHFPAVYSQPQLKVVANNSRRAMVAGINNPPAWLKILLASLSFYQASQSQGIIKYGYAAIGGYYAYKTFRA